MVLRLPVGSFDSFLDACRSIMVMIRVSLRVRRL